MLCGRKVWKFVGLTFFVVLLQTSIKTTICGKLLFVLWKHKFSVVYTYFATVAFSSGVSFNCAHSYLVEPRDVELSKYITQLKPSEHCFQCCFFIGLTLSQLPALLDLKPKGSVSFWPHACFYKKYARSTFFKCKTYIRMKLISRENSYGLQKIH